MVAWSVVSLLTYMAHDYHTMLVCRLLLGVVESPVWSDCVIQFCLYPNF